MTLSSRPSFHGSAVIEVFLFVPPHMPRHIKIFKGTRACLCRFKGHAHDAGSAIG